MTEISWVHRHIYNVTNQIPPPPFLKLQNELYIICSLRSLFFYYDFFQYVLFSFCTITLYSHLLSISFHCTGKIGEVKQERKKVPEDILAVLIIWDLRTAEHIGC